MEDPLEKGLVPIGDDGVILLSAPLGSAEFVGGEIEEKNSPFQICSISGKQICISFQYIFSDFQNFLQSDLYFISMYKQQDLSYHHLGTTSIGCKFDHKMVPAIYRQICAIFQCTGSILKASTMF